MHVINKTKIPTHYLRGPVQWVLGWYSKREIKLLHAWMLGADCLEIQCTNNQAILMGRNAATQTIFLYIPELLNKRHLNKPEICKIVGSVAHTLDSSLRFHKGGMWYTHQAFHDFLKVADRCIEFWAVEDEREFYK